MKRILASMISGFLALALLWPAAAQAQAQASTPPLNLSNAGRELAFVWQESAFGDRIEPHAALLIPVRVEGLDKTLYMQFDLGASSTVLMKDMVESLGARVPGLTTGEDGAIEHFAFTMGDVQARADKVRVVDAHSHNSIAWDDPDRIDIIGTIGADLLTGRVLAIDYPRNRIFVGAAVPEGLVPADQMQPFMVTPRGVVLTGMMIDDQPRMIMLDTGSSAFALLTGHDDWMSKTDGGAGEATFPVNSWGRTLTVHAAPTRSVARFGDTVVPLGEVAYIEGVSTAQADAMRASGMAGMTGNRLFVDKVLVLDAAHSTYAVVDGRR